MQLKTILNAIEKRKSFVHGKAGWSEEKVGREIQMEVRSRKKSKPICAGCGKSARDTIA